MKYETLEEAPDPDGSWGGLERWCRARDPMADPGLTPAHRVTNHCQGQNVGFQHHWGGGLVLLRPSH